MFKYVLALLVIGSVAFADKFTETRIQKAHDQYKLALEKAENSYLRVLEDAFKLYTRRKQNDDAKRIKTMINDFVEGKDLKEDYILPEKGKLRLMTLTPISTKVGWDNLRVNSGDQPLVNGNPCKDFIFAHANSEVRYEIPRHAKYFTAIGCSPHSKSVGFKVVIDGRTAFRLKALSSYKKTDYEMSIKVKIPTNAKHIDLITDDLGDNNSDHSYWAYPEFEIE